MKSKKKPLLLGGILFAILLAGLIVLIASCRSGQPEEEGRKENAVEKALEKDIQKDFSVEETSVYEENENTYLKATLTIPPVGNYMIDCCREAESLAESEFDYGEKLYTLVLEKMQSSQEEKTVTVTINLTEIDYENTNWSESELKKLAKKEAFRREFYEFANYLWTADEEETPA